MCHGPYLSLTEYQAYLMKHTVLQPWGMTSASFLLSGTTHTAVLTSCCEMAAMPAPSQISALAASLSLWFSSAPLGSMVQLVRNSPIALTLFVFRSVFPARLNPWWVMTLLFSSESPGDSELWVTSTCCFCQFFSTLPF